MGQEERIIGSPKKEKNIIRVSVKSGVSQRKSLVNL
jgi:hypothetical protein